MAGQIKVLRTPDAARYLGLSPSTLAKMRLRGDGPAYFKSGRRIVVYDVEELDSYLLKRKRISTSDLSNQGNELSISVRSLDNSGKD